MKLPQRAVSGLKTIGRHAPKPVQELSRRAFRRIGKAGGSAPAASRNLGITPEVIGDTYSPDEVLPALALDNEALRSRLFRTPAAPAQAVTAAADCADPTLAAELVEEYLREQKAGVDQPRHLLIAGVSLTTDGGDAATLIHRRIVEYRESGIAVDVLVCGGEEAQEIAVHDGVRVLRSRGCEIGEMLARRTYRSVGVHCLNRRIWTCLQNAEPSIPIHVFAYGPEARHWIRDVADLSNGTALERAVDATIDQQHLWHDVLGASTQPASYVFASDQLRLEVSQDMRVSFPAVRTQIIAGSPASGRELSVLGFEPGVAPEAR